MLFGLSYIVVLFSLALACAVRPALAVTAVICMFGLDQWGQSSGTAIASNSAFTNIAVGGLVLMALTVSVFRGRRLFGNLPAAYWLSVALFAYALMSLTWTVDLSISAGVWQKAYPYIVTVVLLAPLLCTRVEDFVAVMKALIVFGGAICIAVLFFGQWGNRGLMFQTGLRALETNPLAIASVAGQVLLTVLLVPLSRSRLVRWLAVLIISPVCVAVVMRSGSRGQLLGALTALALAWPLASGRALTLRMIAAPVVVAIFALVAYFSLDYFGGNAGRWQMGLATHDVEGRFGMAQQLLSEVGAYPGAIFFGLGNSASYAILGIYPHIVPLEILGEEGLIGLGLFVSLLVATVWPMRRALKAKHADPAARGALAAVFAAVIFHFVLCCKQGSMLGNTLLFLHAALLPRLAALMTKSAQAKKNDAREPVHVPVTLRTQAPGLEL